jgi:hypothetical protein
MLRKLVKYEFRATSRVLLPLYGTMLLLSLLNRFTISVLKTPGFSFGNLVSGLLMFAYVAVICTTAFMTIFIMAQRFYRNLLGDEGYLMFTLPLPVWHNITAKLIVSVLWSILGVLVTLLSIFFVSFQPEYLTELPRLLFEFKSWLISVGFPVNFHIVLYLLEGALLSVAAIAGSVLIIYASVSLGHLFHRHRILFAFGAFIGLSILSQILSFFLVYPFRNADFEALSIHIGSPAVAHLLLCGSLLVVLLFGAAYFAITNYTLKKRLNLE